MGTRRMAQVVIILVVATSTSTRAGSIMNGAFEEPSIGATPYVTFPPGAPTGWMIVQGTADLVSPAFDITPVQGQQMLDLDGTTPGVIEQSFPTATGTQYRVSFFYANNPYPEGTVPARADVSVWSSGLALSQRLTHSTSTPHDLDWASFSHTFVANAPVSTLRFSSLSPNSSRGGILLDLVSVSSLTTADVWCGGLAATIIGTRGADLLVGTEGEDVIAGLGGDDVIYGLDGADTLCGGSGHDVLLGGEGDDKLFGDNGRDALFGERGSDTLFGGRGNDYLSGGDGDDILQGEQGKDVCDGGAENTGDTGHVSCEWTIKIP